MITTIEKPTMAIDINTSRRLIPSRLDKTSILIPSFYISLSVTTRKEK
jgi:hypothetical protein